MPNLHWSVTTCRCDQIIAKDQLQYCHAVGCAVLVCDGCRKPTIDPEQFACCWAHVARINASLAEDLGAEELCHSL